MSTGTGIVQCSHCAHQGPVETFFHQAMPQNQTRTNLPTAKAAATAIGTRRQAEPAPPEPALQQVPFYQFGCPGCAGQLQIVGEQIGELIDCHHCEQKLVAPDPANGREPILFSVLLSRANVSDKPQAATKISPFDKREPVGDFAKPQAVTEEPSLVAQPTLAAEAAERSGLLVGRTEEKVAHPPAIASEPIEPIQPRTTTTRSVSTIPPAAPMVPATSSGDPQFLELPGGTSKNVVRFPKVKSAMVKGSIAVAALMAVGAVGISLWERQNAAQQAARTQPVPQTSQDQPSIATRGPASDFVTENELLDDLDTEMAGGAGETYVTPPETEEIIAEPASTGGGKVAAYDAATETVKNFFESESLAERMLFVQDANRHKDEMVLHDKKHGSISLADLVHTTTAQNEFTGFFTSMFTVKTNKNEDGFWLAVQQTESGHKISWPAYVQYHDRTFEEFLLGDDTEGKPFRIYVSLAHSFNEKAPDDSKYICVNVQGSHSPSGEGKTQAYIDKRTKAGTEVGDMLEWGHVYPITALVAHSPLRKDGFRRVEIRDLIADHW